MRTRYILLFVTLIVAGCSPSAQLKGLVPASGTVTFGGSPVGGATVVFIPQDGQTNVRSASATTDAEGKFTLMTLQPNDGIYPGTYRVTAEKTVTTGEYREETVPNSDRSRFIDTRMIADMLPAKYKEAETSDLSAEISPKGDRNILLELSGTVDSTPRRPARSGSGGTQESGR
jgi:hypothetical protein